MSDVSGSGSVPGSGLEARRTLVRAAHVVDAAGSTADGWVLLAGAVIEAVGSGPTAPEATEVLDLGDAVLTPGFVDLHGHGGAGAAYEDDAFDAALAVHRAHGTTRSVLSLVANPLPSLVASLERIRTVAATDPLVLGAHLEGPFLSPHNKGAHNESFLVDPMPDVVDALLDAGLSRTEAAAWLDITPQAVAKRYASAELRSDGPVRTALAALLEGADRPTDHRADRPTDHRADRPADRRHAVARAHTDPEEPAP